MYLYSNSDFAALFSDYYESWFLLHGVQSICYVGLHILSHTFPSWIKIY